MKILEFSNQSLMMLVLQEAIIKSPVVAGSSKTITADDNNGLADNDFMLVGQIGEGKSEIAQINATVTAGTDFQVDTLTFPHNVGTPLYKIPYNQVKFYHSATLTGTKTLTDTIAIQADKMFTTLVDDTNSSGYLFFTLYNSETTDESGYSAGFDYGTIAHGSRIKIREFVTSPHNWNQELDEDTFNSLCDFAESEIFSLKRWIFREATTTFSTVADQQAYTKAEAEATNMGQLLFATYDGNPLTVINLKMHERLNWNSNAVSGVSNAILEFANEFELTPIPSEIKTVKLYYYKKSVGFDNETSESAVKLPQAIGFRVLQDLWATVDQKKSQYFEKRYFQTIEAMKLDDKKQVSNMPSLSDFSLNDPLNSPRDIGTLTRPA